MTPDPVRPVEQLAADVRAGLRPVKPTGTTEWDQVDNQANAALDQFVARLSEAERLREERDAGEHLCLTEEEGWRPCPSSLCEAESLLKEYSAGLRSMEEERRLYKLDYEECATQRDIARERAEAAERALAEVTEQRDEHRREKWSERGIMLDLQTRAEAAERENAEMKSSAYFQDFAGRIEAAERALAAVTEQRDRLAHETVLLEALRVELAETRKALEDAAGQMPDPMHPEFPRQFVDRQAKALAIIDRALAAGGGAAGAKEAAVCSKCGRDLHGYRGPLCRYCDGTAE